MVVNRKYAYIEVETLHPQPGILICDYKLLEVQDTMDEEIDLSLPHLQPIYLLNYMSRRGDTPIPSPEWTETKTSSKLFLMQCLSQRLTEPF